MATCMTHRADMVEGCEGGNGGNGDDGPFCSAFIGNVLHAERPAAGNLAGGAMMYVSAAAIVEPLTAEQILTAGQAKALGATHYLALMDGAPFDGRDLTAMADDDMVGAVGPVSTPATLGFVLAKDAEGTDKVFECSIQFVTG